MHRRFAHRTFVAVGVELHHNGAILGSFRTRDLDARAVFIEAPDCDLKENDVVEMHFMIRNATRRKLTRKGVVIRCANDGVAVAFVTTDTIFFQAVEESLTDSGPVEIATDAGAAVPDQSLALRYGTRRG